MGTQEPAHLVWVLDGKRAYPFTIIHPLHAFAPTYIIYIIVIVSPIFTSFVWFVLFWIIFVGFILHPYYVHLLFNSTSGATVIGINFTCRLLFWRLP